MALTANQIFQRVEKKYLMSREQYETFKRCIVPYLEMDQYGLHTICNLYFDTEDDCLIRTSLEKPPYKEKMRLRSYGIPKDEDEVFLELKKKWDGIVYKRRVPMTLKEAKAYIEQGIWPDHDPQMMREMDYFLRFYHPKPKVWLAYDREAYFGKEDKDLRLTIDRNIRTRTDKLALEWGDQGKLLMDEDLYLMEIKVAAAYPVWLAHLLGELQLYPVSFSKYGNYYMAAKQKEEKHQEEKKNEEKKKEKLGGENHVYQYFKQRRRSTKYRRSRNVPDGCSGFWSLHRTYLYGLWKLYEKFCYHADDPSGAGPNCDFNG